MSRLVGVIMTKWIAWALVLVGSSGCYSNLGPVVTDVHMNGDKLRYTRCDLIVPSGFSSWATSSLENCMNEAGKPVQQEAPIKP